MKKIRNIFIYLLAALFVLVLAGIILAKAFEDKVISFIINEINKKLSAEISVSEVSFSLIRKFPDATVIFNEVLIKSGQKDRINPVSDTLLSADRIILSFNVLEILQRKYLLQNIQISKGYIRIYINEKGTGNYEIWQNGPKAEKDQLQIDLKQVRLTDFDVLFQNDATTTSLSLHTYKANLNGRFKGQQFTIESGLQGMINNYCRNGITYIRDQELMLDLIINKLDDRFRIEKAALILNKIRLTGQGEVLQQPEKIVDLQITGQDIKFGAIINYLPVLKMKIPADISYNGRFDVSLMISGSVGKTKMPHIEAVYKIKDAGIVYRKKKIQIDAINMSGIFNNGPMNNAETSVILVSNFTANFRNSTITGSLSMRNLIEPVVEYSIDSQMDLEDITELLNVKSFHFSGHVHTIMGIRGRQAETLNIQKEDLKHFAYKGFVEIRDLHATYTGMPEVIKDVHADVSFDKYMFINRLTGNICNNELILSGRVDNFYEYFIDHSGNLWADLDMYSENFTLDSVFVIMNNLPGNKDHSLNHMPDNLFVKLRFWFDRFTFSAFNATNITGDLFYSPGILTVNRLNGSAMKGSVQALGRMELTNDTNYTIRCNSMISNVDITDLFSSFNNFGQKFILDRHLKGDISGNIDFYGELDKNFKISLPTILTDGELTIRNGELIGFEPMEKLSKFINLEELSHIHFSDMQNEIFISNSKVIIPQMEINSSAINLTGSGIHGFDNYYNYKIKLSLSEFLSKKFGSGRKPDTTDGIIEDKSRGRTYIYLSIDGTPDGMKVSYDKAAAIQGFRNKMNNEKTLLKGIIKEEYGDKVQDTVRMEKSGNGDKSEFFIHWEESNEFLKKPDTVKKIKREKFILEWEEDTLRYE